MIKLKDFVDVNLTSVTPSSTEENKTVVYIYGSYNGNRMSKTLNASNYKAELTNLDTLAQDFVNQFFTLGGASLRVIRVKTTDATSYDIVNSNNNLFLDEIANLPMNQVAIVLREAQTGNIATEGTQYDATGYHYEDIQLMDSTIINCFNVLLTRIQTIVDEQGTAFRKLLVRGFGAPQGGYFDELLAGGTVDETVYPGLTRNVNLIWKLCNSEKDLAGVLAYFSKVTVSNPDSLKDYCFTEELTCTDMKSFFKNVTWNKVKTFVNTDVDLQQNGSIINIGGNTSAQYDMIQEFESIYISQKIVDKEMALLRSKVNLAEAKSVIHSAIIEVLETYYAIGYLVQTQYTGSNIYRNINGKNVCILADGEVITGGYKIIILPKVAGADIHSFPEIEIAINTNKGVRFIKTTGVVL